MSESDRADRTQWRRLRPLLAGLTAAMSVASLTSCIADRLPPADVAIQRDGDGIRITFCEPTVVDELWVNQSTGGSGHEVWSAAPGRSFEPGDVLDRNVLHGELRESATFDFDSTSTISITFVRAGATSVEAEFRLDRDLPEREWLKPDGTESERPCG